MLKHHFLQAACLLVFIVSTGMTAYAADTSQPPSEQEAAITESKTIALGSKRYPDDKMLTIDTGSVTGVYYAAGDAICRMVNRDRAKLGFRCSAKPTLGSVSNIEALRQGNAQIAIVQSDIQEDALHGQDIYSINGAFEPMRSLFSLHDEAFTVIVRRDANIKRLDDLGGRVMNIGPLNSGIRAAAITLMKIKGWTLNYFQATTELRAEEQARELCQNKLDAMILVTGHPSKMVDEISKLCEVRLLPLDDEQVKQFISNNKGYTLTQIPAGLYHGTPLEINTIGVKATVVATTDLSEEVAYKFTKTVFEHLGQLHKVSPVLAKLKPEEMTSVGQVASMHSGAERYFKEAGLLQIEGNATGTPQSQQPGASDGGRGLMPTMTPAAPSMPAAPNMTPMPQAPAAPQVPSVGH